MISNVKCENCGLCGYVGLYDKTETGYKCKDCDQQHGGIVMCMRIEQHGK